MIGSCLCSVRRRRRHGPRQLRRHLHPRHPQYRKDDRDGRGVRQYQPAELFCLQVSARAWLPDDSRQSQPRGAGLLGRKVYCRLADIPQPVDMVDIFRSSRHAIAIVEEAVVLSPRPQVIWMQLGIRNDEAARLAEASGLKVVMNRCPKIEYGRLSSEIAWMGVNTRTLTAKKARLFGRGIQRMALDRVTLAGAADSATRAHKPDDSAT